MFHLCYPLQGHGITRPGAKLWTPDVQAWNGALRTQRCICPLVVSAAHFYAPARDVVALCNQGGRARARTQLPAATRATGGLATPKLSEKTLPTTGTRALALAPEPPCSFGRIGINHESKIDKYIYRKKI